ncbi:MAG TPA: toxin-antitoxin system YwqK family antitoxin [Lacipirellulaceae bacterium]|nr:toxin-antitoxin system YwqK family antitoxin [Lacipirellulaceae bacterium]
MSRLLTPLLPALLLFAACVAGASSAHAQAAGAPGAPQATDPIYLPEPEPQPAPVEVTSGRLPETYEDGTKRTEREVLKLSDDSIVNNGAYVEYFPNGTKFAEGRFDHGVHDGAWSFWHDNGQLCKTVNFIKGMADGAWDVFRADGTLEAKKSYKNNKRDGQWFLYHEDGKTPKVEENYVDGLRDGVSRFYYADGKLQRELHFKNNQMDGPFTEWDAAGRKVAEVNFREGKRHGKLTMHRPDGTTIDQTYDNGRLLREPAAE